MKKAFLPIAMLCAAAASPLAAQEASFTTGPATVINPGLFDCGNGTRASAVGEIASDDGTVWTVPAATNYGTVPFAVQRMRRNRVEVTGTA